MSKDEKMSLEEIRRQFNLGTLKESDLAPDPFSQFSKWYGEAEKGLPVLSKPYDSFHR